MHYLHIRSVTIPAFIFALSTYEVSTFKLVTIPALMNASPTLPVVTPSVGPVPMTTFAFSISKEVIIPVLIRAVLKLKL